MKIKKSAREKRLWDLYRLTKSDFDKMMKFQGGVCAISKIPPKNFRLNIDHCHKSGKIRGLLSMSMNRGLAYFNDNPKLLRAAADYLENPTAPLALGRVVYGLLGKAIYKKKMVYGRER